MTCCCCCCCSNDFLWELTNQLFGWCLRVCVCVRNSKYRGSTIRRFVYAFIESGKVPRCRLFWPTKMHFIYSWPLRLRASILFRTCHNGRYHFCNIPKKQNRTSVYTFYMCAKRQIIIGWWLAVCVRNITWGHMRI